MEVTIIVPSPKCRADEHVACPVQTKERMCGCYCHRYQRPHGSVIRRVGPDA